MMGTMRFVIGTGLSLLLATSLFAAEVDGAREFAEKVRPTLMEYCWDCHDPEDSKGDALFLDAETLDGVSAHRSTWRSVAAQLRNRTMPPPKKPQPEEDVRMRLVVRF